MIVWPPSLIREQGYTNAMPRAGHDSPAPSRTAPGLLLVFGSFGDTFSLVSKCLQGARHSEEREEERKEKRKKKDRRKKNGVPKAGGAFVRQPGRRVRMRVSARKKTRRAMRAETPFRAFSRARKASEGPEPSPRFFVCFCCCWALGVNAKVRNFFPFSPP